MASVKNEERSESNGSDREFEYANLFGDEEEALGDGAAGLGPDADDGSGGSIRDLFLGQDERDTKRKGKGNRTDKNKKRRREQKVAATGADKAAPDSISSLSSDDGDGLAGVATPPVPSAAPEDKKTQSSCTCSCCGIASTEAGS